MVGDSIVNSKFVKRLIYLVFCAFSGAVISSIVWLFLKIMEIGIGFIWKFLPDKINSPFYTPVVCWIGGLLIRIIMFWWFAVRRFCRCFLAEV